MGLFRPKTRTLRSAVSNGARRTSGQPTSEPTSPMEAPEKIYRIRTVGDLLDAYRDRIPTTTVWEPLYGPEPRVRQDFAAVNWSKASSNNDDNESADPLDATARKDSVYDLTPSSTRSSTPSLSPSVSRRMSVVNVAVRELSRTSTTF